MKYGKKSLKKYVSISFGNKVLKRFHGLATGQIKTH